MCVCVCVAGELGLELSGKKSALDFFFFFKFYFIFKLYITALDF